MYKLTILLALLPTIVLANDCVLAQKSRAHATGRIDKIRDVKTTIIVARDQTRRCTVDFQAEVDGVWSSGFGEYTWRSDMPDSVACNNALERGKSSLIELTGNQRFISEQHLTCREESGTPRVIEIGRTLKENEWTPHPRRTNTFWYKGTECQWFIETDQLGRDLYQWEGVVCRVRKGEWVVIDKF